ncbi:GNAT family N-acetyltransferase [Paenibacillus sp. N3.4]|uniref:GNAT family N-acetyltransferase n=1 Tax=Paenibacillus sp. N3.4 TaxID=2603222 RepID=UPI0011CABD5D|nr:GNAT family N-acetyltransferase [Paenibacillus sp. N3.4]TXK73405.1 GNAT family N-acetyltransferase [Paenibacillus sp. N3.4]
MFYEDDRLVGFLAIYCFLSTEVEISGMVHPDSRRQGLFSQLSKAAIEECRRREIPKLIFINERGSHSGKAFLSSLGAQYGFSEYVMDLQEPVKLAPSSSDERVTIRPAQVTDTELLVTLNQSGFNMPEEDAREYVSQTMTGDKEWTWIAELGNRKVPIGKIGAMMEEGGRGLIYGFCVSPVVRGKGYGRQILRLTIEALQQDHDVTFIHLEVAVENEKALGLYESCGFKTKNANDYYELLLSSKAQQNKG